jgi:branched-subunit amino acid aminotransferase/4-amino-4-deoxychorismate lyase
MTLTTRPVGPSTPVRLLTTGVPHLAYRFKTTERIQFERAAAEAQRAGCDDGLMLTGLGEVAEATIWCLYWWEGDTLCAPALDLGILPGVSRMRIEELHGSLAERRVGRRAITGQSLFLSNAVRGIVEVAMLDRAEVPSHPGTAALRDRFWA